MHTVVDNRAHSGTILPTFFDKNDCCHSESDGSDVKDGNIRGVKTAVPAVPVVPVNEKPLTLRVKPSEAYYEKQRKRGRYR